MIKFPQIIERATYIHKIIPFMEQSIIKVFTGQRRVGKSYLLFQIIQLIQKKNKKASIIYINKEDLTFSNIKNALDLNEYVQSKKKENQKNYIFIDEIQEIENFSDALRSLALDPDLDIYCTGSNANLLSRDIAGQLSGRFIEIEVHSLSYTEFLDFHRLESSSESLAKFLKYGGLPYLKHLKLEDEIVFEYLKNIYATIVYRDIVNRYEIRNTPFLEKLVQFLAGNIGSLFSSKKISDFLKSQQVKISTNQVQSYVEYLVNAFLIYKVPRYDMIGKRVFEFGEKYYFENLGIRNGIHGYRIEDRGKIMENAVFNHLKYLGYDILVGKQDQREIDFIAQKNGETHYFQVALSLVEPQTIEREFGNLLKIQDNYPKTVITWEAFDGNTHKGIQTISLEMFLRRE
jgi:predicted AAA+ superfamily ATPase